MKKLLMATAVVVGLSAAPAFADDGVWMQIEGEWDQFKGKITEMWGDMTDDEVDQLTGNRDQLIGTLKKKYGMAQEEAEEQADKWADSLGLSG